MALYIIIIYYILWLYIYLYSYFNLLKVKLSKFNLKHARKRYSRWAREKDHGIWSFSIRLFLIPVDCLFSRPSASMESGELLEIGRAKPRKYAESARSIDGNINRERRRSRVSAGNYRVSWETRRDRNVIVGRRDAACRLVCTLIDFSRDNSLLHRLQLQLGIREWP